MNELLIVYHSQSGANELLARAAWHGASRIANAKVTIKRAAEAESRDFLQTRTVLCCCAEMNGSLAGGMKELLDRVFYPILKAEHILTLAAIMSTGNDGTGATRQLQRIATGLNAHWAAAPTLVKGIPQAADLNTAKELAQALIEGSRMGIY